MINEPNAASSDEQSEVTETTTLTATGDTTSTIQDVTTEGTDGDDEGDLKPESDDGKIDAVKVNEIVKRRVEKHKGKKKVQLL